MQNYKQFEVKPMSTVPGSHIEYFKNGVSLGIAFQGIFQGTIANTGKYYPAISLYNGGKVKANFGPDFQYTLPEDAKGMHEATQLPKWTPFLTEIKDKRANAKRDERDRKRNTKAGKRFELPEPDQALALSTQVVARDPESAILDMQELPFHDAIQIAFQSTDLPASKNSEPVWEASLQQLLNPNSEGNSSSTVLDGERGFLKSKLDEMADFQ